MEKNFEEFRRKVDRRMANMDAKLEYMHKGIMGFREELKDFREEFHDFIDFTHENYQDHEKRLVAIESKLSKV